MPYRPSSGSRPAWILQSAKLVALLRERGLDAYELRQRAAAGHGGNETVTFAPQAWSEAG
jgi:hypothetical protein